MNYWAHTDYITSGDGFVCLPGGDSHIPTAYAKGASTHIHLSRKEWALFARSLVYDSHPITLCIIGITGTNGKTSTATALAYGLTQLGYTPYVQGTLTQALTTPDCMVTYQAMRAHQQAGGTHFIMEVSSHGIDQDRVYGMPFTVKALTNITQDHLDYHKTLDAYRQTKLGFMKQQPDNPAICITDYQSIPIVAPQHTIMDENRRLAKAILMALNLPDTDCDRALPADLPWPPGRLECVAVTPCRVIVDFAHTPDALTQALQAVRVMTTQHVWVVMGCGGDRDTGKRAVMGQIAGEYADQVIVTTDNPRTEDPDQIADAIMQSVPESKRRYIPDRRIAIQTALNQARSDDVILVAGKGHELYQYTATGVEPCHDPSIIRDCIRSMAL